MPYRSHPHIVCDPDLMLFLLGSVLQSRDGWFFFPFWYQTNREEIWSLHSFQWILQSIKELEQLVEFSCRPFFQFHRKLYYFIFLNENTYLYFDNLDHQQVSMWFEVSAFPEYLKNSDNNERKTKIFLSR